MKSIDRLREYVTGPARCGISPICEKIILKELDSIEREVGEMQRALTIDTQPMTDENMAEHGWVRLPVDAEGVPIHVGDVMEWPDCSTAEVVGIGDGTFFYVEEDEYAAEWTAASDKIHHHAPTVEDVLREFAAKLCIRDGFPTATEETFAEYAAKLTLRGDE